MADQKTAPWRNRIIRSADVPASDFLANPLNWRLHPKYQQEALLGVLQEVGWVGRALVNLRSGKEWPKGERNVETLVDGHLRVTLALREQEATGLTVLVPTDYVDLSPSEEAIILGTLDPIAALASMDYRKLQDVIKIAQPQSQAVIDLLAEIGLNTINMPNPEKQKEPQLVADHVIEIMCSNDNFEEVCRVLDELDGMDNVSVNIS